MNMISQVGGLVIAMALGCTTAVAQPTKSGSPDQSTTVGEPSKASSSAPASLVVLFENGSSALRAQDRATLDRAARAYNEGKPIVMVLTGSSDRVGDAKQNLSLSQMRATAVLKGLLDRGIPADRFQVLAKGVTELPVPTQAGVAEDRNRSVEISWH